MRRAPPYLALSAAAQSHSILFPFPDIRGGPISAEAPECFRDLNLDQIVVAIIARSQDYDLAAFFHTPLRDRDAIAYRQEDDVEASEPIRRSG
jgi:DNA mismatch repair protein MutS